MEGICGISPELLEPPVPAASGPVAVVLNGIFYVVILVVLFGGIKLCRRLDLGHDWFFKRLRFFQCGLRFECETFLLLVEIEDRAPILASPVAKLAIRRRRIDIVPEDIEQLLIAYLLRIENDLNRLSVSGPARRNFLIGRVFLLPSRITGGDGDHTL